MKRQVFMAATFCCLFVLAAVAPAFAQLPGTEIRAMIPFDFMVRGRLLPAGEYDVKRVFDSPESLRIQNEATHKTEVFETDAVEARRIPSNARLVFHRYGDDYFLDEIWTPGLSTGREFSSHSHRAKAQSRSRAQQQPAGNGCYCR
jgi:hypothetical protein